MTKLLAGIAGNQAGIFNARAADNNAQAASAEAAATAERVAQEGRMAAGEAIASQGQSGLQLGTGSALDLLRENAIQTELDRQTVYQRGENKRRGFQADAMLQRAQAKNALIAGIVGTAEDVAMAAGGGGGGGGDFAAAKAATRLNVSRGG
jgi:hypothetical protein